MSETSIKWPVKMSTACIIIDANGDYLTKEQDAEVCRRANEYKSLVDAHKVCQGIISRNDKREKRINELEQQLEALVEAIKCYQQYQSTIAAYSKRTLLEIQLTSARALLEKARKYG